MVATGDLLAQFGLEPELRLKEAAALLSVHTKTVQRYIDQGTLVARNAAPPASLHRDWRIPLSAVLAVRGDYQSHCKAKGAPTCKRRVPKYVPQILKPRA